MVTYWNLHYTCFFRDLYSNNLLSKEWKLYDDHTIIKFDSWKDVLLECVKGHTRPTLLFYQKIDKNIHFLKKKSFKEQVAESLWDQFQIYANDVDREMELISQEEEKAKNANAKKSKENEKMQ